MRARHALPAVAAFLLAEATPAAAQEVPFGQIERGRYLTTASNCLGCHTDFERDGPPFAGGRELHTPFGTILSANITFDATGIGSWSRDDFWEALHKGRRKDGAQLYPAMPYPSFTKMPREDVDAIYDYLRSLPPVVAEHVPEEGLPLPLRFRFAVRGWNLLNFEPGVLQPDPAQSDEWNRGRYLVDGPAHCGGCHTGKTLTGADDSDECLRGGVLENWHAPNIRGGTNGGLADWSEEQVVRFLAAGRNEHTGAMTRMGEVVSLSTLHMTPEDLSAIAIYLKSLDDVPRGPFDAPDAAVMERGAAIFFDVCSACHATDGSGVSGIFARLDGSTKLRSEDATTVIRIILEGTQSVATEASPGPLAMPASHWKLTDAQIADLVTYLRNAWSNSGPPVTESEVSRLRDTLSEDWQVVP